MWFVYTNDTDFMGVRLPHLDLDPSVWWPWVSTWNESMRANLSQEYQQNFVFYSYDKAGHHITVNGNRGDYEAFDMGTKISEFFNCKPYCFFSKYFQCNGDHR